MDRVPALTAQADLAWAERTGRSYGVVERYRCDGAQTVIVTMGSMRTAREAVDLLRDAGHAVGLLKIRLFRPLPVQAITESLVEWIKWWCWIATITGTRWRVKFRNCAPRFTAARFRRSFTVCCPAWRCERLAATTLNFIQQMRKPGVGPNRNGKVTAMIPTASPKTRPDAVRSGHAACPGVHRRAPVRHAS